MSRLGAITLSALLLATAASPVAAQWMWRDKTRGNQVTYSDRPPPAHVADSDILKRPHEAPHPVATPSSAASGPRQERADTPRLPQVDPVLEARRKEAEKQEAARKKSEEDRLARAKAENCKRARQHMQALDQGMRIAQTNTKGETEIMDDKARSAETKRTRDIISSDCQ